MHHNLPDIVQFSACSSHSWATHHVHEHVSSHGAHGTAKVRAVAMEMALPNLGPLHAELQADGATVPARGVACEPGALHKHPVQPDSLQPGSAHLAGTQQVSSALIARGGDCWLLPHFRYTGW